jgi:hypothetical protein
MENLEPLKSRTGTHPLLTMVLFGAIIASFVGAGSYVSKQRSLARAVEADAGPAITFFEVNR